MTNEEEKMYHCNNSMGFPVIPKKKVEEYYWILIGFKDMEEFRKVKEEVNNSAEKVHGIALRIGEEVYEMTLDEFIERARK